MDETVTIIGAGMAGSLLGLLLARRGLRVDIYERRPDMRRQAISAGRSINLALANRGLAALTRAGLEDQVRPLLTTMRGRMVHDGEHSADAHFQPYGQRDEEVIYSVGRGGLNRLLMDAAEQQPNVNFHFDMACVDIDYTARVLEFEHGPSGERRRIEGGPVIGADGAGSRLRRALVAQCGAQASEDFLPHDYKELTIPPAPGGAWRLAPDALHIWPRGGFMMIALPNLDGSFTATLFAPREGADGFDRLCDEAAVAAYFSTHFPDVVPHMPGYVEEFLSNPQGRMVTVRCRPWTADGFALLIGDASHAIVPFHGQGMNAAFEDCAELDALFAEALGSGHGRLAAVDVAALFQRFEALRKPNADAIAAMALDNYVEMRDSVRDPLFLRRRELSFELERRHPGVFIPRYAMVMFHRLPYDHARQRGAAQQRLLERVVPDTETAVDIALADRLVASELRPLIDRLAQAPAQAASGAA